MLLAPVRRRILVAGSAGPDASPDSVRFAHALLRALVPGLVEQGATFVIPIDAEPLHKTSGEPVTFDWTVLETAWAARESRPDGDRLEPLMIAVSHTKGLRQIPEARRALWEEVRSSSDVRVVSLGEMNSGALRREEQARHASAVVLLGGSEGALHLAELLHAAGDAVIPLNLPLGNPASGAELLARLAPSRPTDFFRSIGLSEVALLDSVDLSSPTDALSAAGALADLLRQLRAPTAFCVRLLNADIEAFDDVETYFADVVTPVADERGYTLVTVGRGTPEEAFLNLEIFERLHHADVVLADLTGSRPNCYLELGYALGRALPTLATAMTGTRLAFDTQALPTHFWKKGADVLEAREELRREWDQQIGRPPIMQRRSLL